LERAALALERVEVTIEPVGFLAAFLVGFFLLMAGMVADGTGAE
jgi:hypothetical protein